MAKTAKARLYLNNSFYCLVLADGSMRQLEQDEVRKFILSFDEPSHYTSTGIADAASSEGMLLAEVSTKGQLVLSDPFLLMDLFQDQGRYISAVEYAKLYGKGRSLIYRFCREGRITGAILRDRRWWIPEGTPYPDLEKRGRKVPTE